MKTLVIYYSRRGQNYVSGRIVSLKKGNTERIAELIRAAVNADLFEIETVKDYSADYTACTKESKDELNHQKRPALKHMLDNIEDYDRIVIAGPCWWGTYPMAVFTQLEQLNWNGKHVFPLMTHEGSGMGNSVRDLRTICKGAQIEEGLAVHGSSIPENESRIRSWAEKNLL